MRLIVLSPLLCLGLALMAKPGLLLAETVPPFSTMTSLDKGWQPLQFPDIDRHTDYQLVTIDGVQVVKAMTDGGASGLIAKQRIETGDSLVLRWRWKVSNVFDKGDARKKSGDDYPARIYVAFAFQPEKASFFERAKRAAVSTLFGEELPGNALNYIWANRLEVGSTIANPYTESTQMIAVNSGARQAGQWVTVERDIVADYRRAFGEAPPPIVGIAIMTDGDNTGAAATAWYGDIIVDPGS
jgi:hypothetical protein